MPYELEAHHRNVPDDELVAELRRVAGVLGKNAVTIDQFNDHATFHSSTLFRRFGSWFKALEAAGLEKTRNLNLTNEQLFENLVSVWLKLGRQPKYNDLTEGTFPLLSWHIREALRRLAKGLGSLRVLGQ